MIIQHQANSTFTCELLRHVAIIELFSNQHDTTSNGIWLDVND